MRKMNGFLAVGGKIKMSEERFIDSGFGGPALRYKWRDKFGNKPHPRCSMGLTHEDGQKKRG
jgi:hypothetical protein